MSLPCGGNPAFDASQENEADGGSTSFEQTALPPWHNKWSTDLPEWDKRLKKIEVPLLILIYATLPLWAWALLNFLVWIGRS